MAKEQDKESEKQALLREVENHKKQMLRWVGQPVLFTGPLQPEIIRLLYSIFRILFCKYSCWHEAVLPKAKRESGMERVGLPSFLSPVLNP